VRVEVLGPVRTAVDGQQVELPSAGQQAVLALLAIHGGQTVGHDEIAAAVWGSFPPGGPVRAVRECVASLRATLARSGAAEVIQTTAGGYRLHRDRHTSDLGQLREQAREARRLAEAGDHEGSFALLAKAVSGWRGEVASSLPMPLRGRPAFAAVEQERVATELEYVALGTRLGRHEQVLPTAERLVSVAPTDPTVTAAYLAVVSRRSVAAGPAGQVPWRGPGAPVPRLVGRDADLARLAGLLPERRLLSLVGPAGSGKTSLGLQLAGQVRDRFAGGVTVVELADVRDPRRLAARILDLLGVTGGAGTRDHLTMLVRALGNRAHLLVLDNLEHLVVAGAELTDRLLRACSGLTVLATSREPMGLPGETVWRVEPLAVPQRSDVPAEQLATVDSVRLFLARAAEAQPAFSLTDANAPAVATVCQRLDGLPLAIELAAACLRTATVDTVAERLTDRFRLLAPIRRGGPRHHRSLAAALQWSYDCLEAPEQRLLARLSVLGLDVTPEAARAVCGAPPLTTAAIEPLLDRLVDKSLLQPRPDGYRMLESVHAFAAERLAELGESEPAGCRQRLVEWALGWAGESRKYEFLPDRDALVAEHQRQLPAVRAALREAAAARDWHVVARLLADGRMCWETSPALAREALSWVPRLPAAASPLPDPVRAGVEYTWASASWMLGLRRDAANHCAAAATAVPPGTPEAVTIGYRRAHCAMALVDPAAPGLAEEALRQARGLGDPRLVAEAHGTAADIAFIWCDYERSAGLYLAEWELRDEHQLVAEPLTLVNAGLPLAELGRGQEALEVGRRGGRGYPDGHPVKSWALGVLGLVHVVLEQYEPARELLAESVRLQRADAAFAHPIALAALAEVEYRTGDRGAAVALIRQSLETALAAERMTTVLPALPVAAVVMTAVDQRRGRALAHVLAGWHHHVRPALSNSSVRKLAPLWAAAEPESGWRLDLARARRSPGAALGTLAQQVVAALR
jgi:predicted ATPase/DNA-binding SARP family transcriptional activator